MKQLILTAPQVFHALKRFPLTFFCCLLFCVTGIFNNHYPGIINVDFALVTSFVSSVLFTSSQLFKESTRARPSFNIYVVSLFIIGVVTTYLLAFPKTFYWSAPLFIVATLALVPIAPFLKKVFHRDQIFCFTAVLAIQIIFALLIVAIIFAGLAAVAVSITLLFGINYPAIFFDIGILIASLLFSLMTLTKVPDDFSQDHLVFGVHFLQALIGYLVLPLIMLYGGILYWYFLVVCFTQDLPKGVIVYMAAGFGSVGIFVYLALDHTKTYNVPMINLFHQYFFKTLLVPLFLAALAISIRIYEYGLSPARYVAVVLFIWMLSVVSFSFTRYHHHMSRFIYLSTSSFALLAALSIIYT